MGEQILTYLEHAGSAIGLFAVAVIVVGFVLAWTRYVLRFRELPPEQNFKRLSIKLARVLTLGLEILVLADVIETVTVEPSFRSLAVLVVLVVLRTILSWTLALQIEGRWPWQRPVEEPTHA
jgi:uncharacterized membrane protein